MKRLLALMLLAVLSGCPERPMGAGYNGPVVGPYDPPTPPSGPRCLPASECQDLCGMPDPGLCLKAGLSAVLVCPDGPRHVVGRCH